MESAHAHKAEDTTKTTHAAPEVALKSETKADGGAAMGMPMFLQRSVAADPEMDAQTEEDILEASPEDAATESTLQAKLLSNSLQRQEETPEEDIQPEISEEPETDQALQTKLLATGGEPLQRQITDETMAEDGVGESSEGLEEDAETTADEPPLLQPKLTINPPNDDYEQEADQVADAVVQREALSGSAFSPPTASPIGATIQRKCDACEAEEQAQTAPDEDDEAIQRQASSTTAVDPHALPQSIRPHDSGTPLPAPVKDKIEPVVGADLSGVRVHDSDEDRQVAHSLKAQAFTHKNHIWLGKNQRADDVKLMSHESAHVVQQTAGSEPIQRLQRKPADYQHPEDGGGVHSRLRARFRDEIPEQEEGTSAASDSESTANADADRSRNRVDPAELRSRSSEVQGDTAPDVDRPAQERPQVEQAAATAQQEAESAPEALVEGEGSAEPEAAGGDSEGAEGEASSAAEQAAGLAEQAFAAAAAQTEPGPEVEVQPPPPVTPVDAGGEPLEADPDAESAISDIAGRIQYLREQGTLMRTQASEGHANAEIIRGNIARVSGEVTKAEEGIATAQDHAQHRHEVVGQATEALGVSQEKQATVAADAPGYQTKADEGKEDSGPMASEAGTMASENAANTPSDSDAAAKSREQGQKINQVGDDAQTMDGAISQTRSRADSLVGDAERAAELNTQTQEKISTGQQALEQTDQRLSQHQSQTGQARAQVDGMASAPDEVHAQANQLNDQGQQLIESSFALEGRLNQSQQNYATQMQGIPEVEPWQGEIPGEDGALQAQEDTSQPSDGEPPAPVATPEPTAAPAASEDAIETGLEPGAEPTAPTEEPEPPAAGDAAGVEPPAEGETAGGGEAATDEAAGDAADALAPTAELGPRQERSAIDSDVPPWVTGVDPDSVASREERRQQVENQRREEIGWFNQQLGGRSVAQIGVGERFGLVGSALSRRFQKILGNIKWPGWGGLAKMLLDPRSLLAGAVGGLGMILSGGANLFSLEQWQRDPLGNLLTSAANIATGLAVILGSITALAGLVAAIMGALILITFGAASPIALPVISVCTTIITTVGGWTIAVGKVALVLQALALIKNLIDVATAQTADDLQRETEEISGNINGSFQAVMSIVGAKGAQAGLAGVRNRAAGVIRASRRAGGAGALARQTASRGAAAVGRGTAAVGRGIGRGAAAVGRGVVAGGRAVGRGVVAGGRAVVRGLAAGGRTLGRGVVAGGRALGRGVRGLRDRLRQRFGRGRVRPQDLIGRSRPVRLGGSRHNLSIRRFAGRIALILCTDCGPLINQLDDIIARLPARSGPVFRRVSRLRTRALKLQRRIAAGKLTPKQAQARLDGLGDRLEAIGRRFPGERALSGVAITYGRNFFIKIRKHSEQMRRIARGFGVAIPRSPANPATVQRMQGFIQQVVRTGQTKFGRYMTFPDAQWSKLGNGIVIRRANGEFVTFLDYSKGAAARGWDRL